MLWVLKSTHNICFHGKIRKISIDIVWLKKNKEGVTKSGISKAILYSVDTWNVLTEMVMEVKFNFVMLSKEVQSNK